MKAILAATAACLALFASCGGKEKGPETEVLRTNVRVEPDSLFPWKSAAADTRAILRNIFEGLMTFDENGKIIPCLAESVTESDDHLQYKFALRKGVLFHNGAPFTSADAVYTYENLAGLNGRTPVSSSFGSVKEIAADGDYGFTVTLSKPVPTFLIQATEPIIPRGYDKQTESPVGSGPYKFASYDIGQKIVLERFDGYWNKKGRAKIARVEIYIMSDETAVLSALQSGQIHYAQSVSAPNARALEKKFSIQNYPQNMVQILGMNTMVKPLNDARVRKAVAMAVNKDEIISGIFAGYATKLYSNFSPILGEFYNDKLKGENQFSPEKAKALLAEAGYHNGFSVTITVPASYQMHVDTAEIIQGQLAKIGIRAIINPIEWAAWLDQVYSKFNYEMTIIAFSGKLDPADVLRRYYSTYNRNFTRYYNEEFDADFQAAQSETDLKERIRLYKECQRFLAEDCPAVFICDPNTIGISVKNLRGHKGYPVSYYDYSSLYFE